MLLPIWHSTVYILCLTCLVLFWLLFINFTMPYFFSITPLITAGRTKVVLHPCWQQVAAAGTPTVDTSPLGTGRATRSPPTGRTRPPSHRSGSSAAGGQYALPWRRTPAVAPSGPPPPASSPAENRGSGCPVGGGGSDVPVTVCESVSTDVSLWGLVGVTTDVASVGHYVSEVRLDLNAHRVEEMNWSCHRAALLQILKPPEGQSHVTWETQRHGTVRARVAGTEQSAHTVAGTALTSRGRQLNVVDLTKASREDGGRSWVVTEPIRTVHSLWAINPNHQVSISQDLPSHTHNLD